MAVHPVTVLYIFERDNAIDRLNIPDQYQTDGEKLDFVKSECDSYARKLSEAWDIKYLADVEITGPDKNVDYICNVIRESWGNNFVRIIYVTDGHETQKNIGIPDHIQNESEKFWYVKNKSEEYVEKLSKEYEKEFEGDFRIADPIKDDVDYITTITTISMKNWKNTTVKVVYILPEGLEIKKDIDLPEHIQSMNSEILFVKEQSEIYLKYLSQKRGKKLEVEVDVASPDLYVDYVVTISDPSQKHSVKIKYIVEGEKARYGEYKLPDNIVSSEERFEFAKEESDKYVKMFSSVRKLEVVPEFEKSRFCKDCDYIMYIHVINKPLALTYQTETQSETKSETKVEAKVETKVEAKVETENENESKSSISRIKIKYILEGEDVVYKYHYLPNLIKTPNERFSFAKKLADNYMIKISNKRDQKLISEFEISRFHHKYDSDYVMYIYVPEKINKTPSLVTITVDIIFDDNPIINDRKYCFSIKSDIIERFSDLSKYVKMKASIYVNRLERKMYGDYKKFGEKVLEDKGDYYYKYYVCNRVIPEIPDVKDEPFVSWFSERNILDDKSVYIHVEREGDKKDLKLPTPPENINKVKPENKVRFTDNVITDYYARVRRSQMAQNNYGWNNRSYPYCDLRDREPLYDNRDKRPFMRSEYPGRSDNVYGISVSDIEDHGYDDSDSFILEDDRFDEHDTYGVDTYIQKLKKEQKNNWNIGHYDEVFPDTYGPEEIKELDIDIQPEEFKEIREIDELDIDMVRAARSLCTLKSDSDTAKEA